MQRLWLFVMIIVLLTSCTTIDKDSHLNLQNQIDSMTREQVVLQQKVDQLEDMNFILKEENAGLKTDLLLTYRDAIGFRKDIFDVFSQFESLRGSSEPVYYGKEDLNKNQKAIISEALASYYISGNEAGALKYDAAVFIGEKPEPFIIAKVIGIVDSQPMYYYDGDVEKTLHFDVYAYRSTLFMNGDLGGKPFNYFRGPFAGVSMLHLAIEEVDGTWKVVYIGLG